MSLQGAAQEGTNDDSELGEDPDRGPAVEVLHINSVEKVKFHVPWTTVLNEVWTKAYSELDEQRQPGDKFQCRRNAVDLTPHLGLTLKELREKGICPSRKFQIAGETGGA